MKTKLRVAGLLVAVVVAAFWFFGGANRGWTKTSVPRVEKDPVTEIQVNVYEKRFVPGVDFLGAGMVFAALLAGSSVFFRRTSGKDPL
jgi:hypothetical protein